MRHLTVFLAGVLAILAGTNAYAQVQREAAPYVVAFTFQGNYSFDNLPPEEALAVFNEGALDGWGLKCGAGAYSIDPVQGVEERGEAIAFLKSRTNEGKHIWPVLFVTRILKPGKGIGSHPPEARRKLAGIPGIDLENETGAREAFERDWRNGLRIAKALGSPGIMFDCEWYTNGDISVIEKLARMRGEDEATTIAKCEALGARLAGIIEESYPEAVVIWFYTGLHEPEAQWTSIARIALGAVKRSKEIGSEQLHVDGGENGVGYLHRSLDALKARIHNRWIETRELLLAYPNFQLGGVLAPYVDVKERVTWMRYGEIGSERTADDFQGHFEALFTNYRYTWLYGTHMSDLGFTGFNPWEAKHSAAMSGPLRRAKKSARYGPPDPAAMSLKKVPEEGSFDSLEHAGLAREVWVDLGAPGNAKIVPQYWRGRNVGPNAADGEGGRVVPEPIEAGGKKWTARMEFDRNKVPAWPWPGISLTDLPAIDLRNYEAIAVEVHNPNDKPLKIRFSLFTDEAFPNDLWGASTSEIAANSSQVLSYANVTKPIKAISFAGVNSPDPVVQIYVSPVFLIRSASAYVVGFTFQNGYSFDNIPPQETLQVFNDGALDGWGMSYVGASDFKKGLAPADLEKEIDFLRTNTRLDKHVWPVMFITQIIQPQPGKANWMPRKEKRKTVDVIRGMDLEDEAGARQIFEENWRNALHIAKALDSPGIMFDPEWYTNGDIRYIDKLAKMRGEDETTTIAKCEALGARLADITEAAYPGAVVIWFYTGLHTPKEEWTSVARICLGAIKRAKEICSKQLHVDGGESGLGYLHRSVDALKARIHNRWIETRGLLLTYPNFEMGGVLAPYVDVTTRVAWMTFDRIGSEQKAADFQPHFGTLFTNYRYTWIYGAGVTDLQSFHPWQDAHSKAMSAPLARAKENARYAPPDLAKLPEAKRPEGLSFDSLDYAQLAREVWVDLGTPGNAKIVPHYWRGQSQDPNAATGEGGRVIGEPVEAAGKSWTARIEFDRSKVSKWPWPAISLTNLPLNDISAYAGMTVEVYNPSDKPLYVRFALFTPGAFPNDQWGCLNETVPAKSSYVFSFTGVTKPINAISFAAVKQPDPVMRIYVSRVFLIRE